MIRNSPMVSSHYQALSRHQNRSIGLVLLTKLELQLNASVFVPRAQCNVWEYVCNTIPSCRTHWSNGETVHFLVSGWCIILCSARMSPCPRHDVTNNLFSYSYHVETLQYTLCNIIIEKKRWPKMTKIFTKYNATHSRSSWNPFCTGDNWSEWRGSPSQDRPWSYV